MNNSTSGRIGWIDTARGMAIIAVIVCHTGLLPHPDLSHAFLTAWMLPLFALTGGWLFNPQTSLVRFVVHKTRKLLIPYFVFSLVSFLSWLGLRHFYPVNPYPRALADVWTGFDRSLLAPAVNTPLWFLLTYFASLVIVRTIFPWWQKSSAKIGVAAMLIVSTLIMSRPASFQWGEFSFWIFLSGMIMAGAWAAQGRLPIRLNNRQLAGLGLVLAAGALLNGPVDIYAGQVHYPLLFLLNALTGSYLIAALGCRIRHDTVPGRLFTFFGRHSLLFLAIHLPLFHWFYTLLFYARFWSSVPGTPFHPVVNTLPEHIFSIVLRLAVLGLYLGILGGAGKWLTEFYRRNITHPRRFCGRQIRR